MNQSAAQAGAAAFAPSAAPKKISALLGLVTPLFRAHWLRLALGFVALMGVNLLQLFIPRLVKTAVDALAEGSANSNALMRIAGLIVLIALVMALLRFWWRILIIGFSRILEQTLRNRLFDHILRMDQPFFERWTTGDLMAHATNDLNVIQMACGIGLVAAVDAVLMSSATLGFMFAISVKLSLIVLIPMPLLIIATQVLSGMLHHRFNKVQEQFSLLTEFARNALVSIRLIKAYTLERFQEQRFESLGRDYVGGNLKVARIQGLLSPISTVVGSAGMLLLLYYGGGMVIAQQMSIGSFVAFISYLSLLIWPMMAVGWVANLVQRGVTSLRRIDRLLSEQPVVDQRPVKPLPMLGKVSYVCANLSFTYAGGQQPALQRINLRLESGLLGVTGRTGSGKSTLCKLLLRLYPVQDGMLFFQGQDVNTLAQADIRAQIAYVSQEPFVFAGSIADNISLGKPDASHEEIEAAAWAAVLDEEIRGFDGAYQARIGERGLKLSGGQRQRLALARALLCKRPLLIIDDGLSAVDVETEQEIMRRLQVLARDCAVLLVSHRINVLRHADHIVILEEGRISAQGEHQHLLEHPFYRVMAEKQQSDV